MKSKRIVLFGLAAIGAGLVAYPAGRHVAVVSQVSHGGIPISKSIGPFARLPKSRSEEIDLTKARIENAGSLGSEQVFDLILGADAQLRGRWAKQLEEMPFGPKKRAAVRSFYKTLVQVDSTEAAHLVVNSKEPASREWAIRGAISGATPAEMGNIAWMLDQLGPEIRSAYIYVVIWNWTLADPVAASAYLEQRLTDTEPIQAYLLVHNWTTIDPESAKAWLDRVHLNEGQRWQAIKGLAGGLLERDRKSTLDFLIANSGDDDFSVAINTVAQDSFLHSPDETRDFVLRLSRPEVQNEAIEHIAKLTGSERIEEMRRSEEDVAKWLISLPPELWRKHIGEVEQTWSDKDPDAFSAWLEQLSPENRDMAVAGYCAQISSWNLEDAIVFGRKITDPSLREETLRSAIVDAEKTPAEIKEVLDMLRLTPQQKAELVRFIPEE